MLYIIIMGIVFGILFALLARKTKGFVRYALIFMGGVMTFMSARIGIGQIFLVIGLNSTFAFIVSILITLLIIIPYMIFAGGGLKKIME